MLYISSNLNPNLPTYTFHFPLHILQLPPLQLPPILHHTPHLQYLPTTTVPIQTQLLAVLALIKFIHPQAEQILDAGNSQR